MTENNKNQAGNGISLSYKYRLYPTPEQEAAIDFEFRACRFVFNH